MAANEIERLKSIRMDSVDITDLRSPGSYYPRDRKDIWKNYSAVLSDFKSKSMHRQASILINCWHILQMSTILNSQL